MAPKDGAHSRKDALTGAEIVIRALTDQGVDTVFGYPGGAVLPIYDAIYRQNALQHVLVRHEQGAAEKVSRVGREENDSGRVPTLPGVYGEGMGGVALARGGRGYPTSPCQKDSQEV